ncbi:MAG: hypothetical protein ACOC1K_00905 [Nanoarchaeota archaeon]
MGKIDKNKLQMAYDLSSMATYAKSNGQELIVDLITKSNLFAPDNGLRVIQGIKSTDKFADIADGGTHLQKTSGDLSSLTPSGSTTLADIDISVTEIAVIEKYVKDTITSKITQMLLKPGSDYSNELPYADVLVDLKSKTIAKTNELHFWQGSTSGTYNVFDGILQQLSDGGTPSGAASGMTTSNAISHVEAVIKAGLDLHPEWLTNTTYLYMSPAQFNTYRRAVYGLGSTIDRESIVNNVVESFFVPGYDIKVISTAGLEGVNNIVFTRENNFVVGTDLQSEDDQFKFEYLNESLYWRLLAVYKLGAKVCRTDEVYYTT